MRRTTQPLGSLLAVMALLGACSFAPGPGSTVKEFITDVDGGKITEAVQLLSLPSGMEPKVKMALTVAAQETKPEDRVRYVEIVKEDVRGEIARVDYIVHRVKKTDEDTQHMDLHKVDGKWKIELTGLPGAFSK
jgi:hypothetical protein